MNIMNKIIVHNHSGACRGQLLHFYIFLKTFQKDAMLMLEKPINS
jgi:hypothetical protein